MDETLILLEGGLESITSFDLRLSCSIKLLLKMDYTFEMFEGKKRPIIKSTGKLNPDDQPVIRKQEYRQVFQNGKGRVEVLDPDGKSIRTVFAYDREIQKSYRPREKDALIRAKATQLIEEGWDYREAFETVYGDFSILTCFRERKKKATTRIAPNSNSIIILEACPDPEANNTISYQKLGFRVFLDKNHGFLPAAIETFEMVKDEPFIEKRVTVEEWKDLGGGNWVPIKTKTQVYLPNPELPTFGEVYSESYMVVDLARSSWNKPIPETTFAITLPAGTKVIDQSRQVQFVTGKSDPGTNLDDLAANARHVVPYPITKPPPRVQRQSAWVWVAAGAGTLLAAFLLWFSIHSLRHRRTKYAK